MGGRPPDLLQIHATVASNAKLGTIAPTLSSASYSPQPLKTTSTPIDAVTETRKGTNPKIHLRTQVTPAAVASASSPAALEKHLQNGDLYIGSFSSHVPQGSGKYLWADGCMYQGDWKRDKASGKGKFSSPSGATFEGEFKSGWMEGFGTFTGSDDDTYRGSWTSDRQHGYGQKRYVNIDYSMMII
ncbi:hypothetical protein RJ640_000183 [Escallonia rubra]|uniref:Uncharacterized protein n=1 Tax=Escallonia rubra TaxID=112253 RepID=A0AA88RT59_9ASTE|nr:hypothetical protein RJ640_000183 [Escallonia rubra]